MFVVFLLGILFTFSSCHSADINENDSEHWLHTPHFPNVVLYGILRLIESLI